MLWAWWWQWYIALARTTSHSQGALRRPSGQQLFHLPPPIYLSRRGWAVCKGDGGSGPRGCSVTRSRPAAPPACSKVGGSTPDSSATSVLAMASSSPCRLPFSPSCPEVTQTPSWPVAHLLPCPARGSGTGGRNYSAPHQPAPAPSHSPPPTKLSAAEKDAHLPWAMGSRGEYPIKDYP